MKVLTVNEIDNYSDWYQETLTDQARSRSDVQVVAARHAQHLAGDEAGLLAGEERHGVGDVLRLPDPAERRLVLKL
jgi:hypothetical protein